MGDPRVKVVHNHHEAHEREVSVVISVHSMDCLSTCGDQKSHAFLQHKFTIEHIWSHFNQQFFDEKLKWQCGQVRFQNFYTKIKGSLINN